MSEVGANSIAGGEGIATFSPILSKPLRRIVPKLKKEQGEAKPK